MRHRVKTIKLNRTSGHRRALLANLAMAIIENERIQTTLPKAKAMRSIVENLITLAKKGDVHSRRLALRVIPQRKVIQKLFNDLGPRFKERQGGYTRILKSGFRAGDKAPMAYISFTEESTTE